MMLAGVSLRFRLSDPHIFLHHALHVRRGMSEHHYCIEEVGSTSPTLK